MKLKNSIICASIMFVSISAIGNTLYTGKGNIVPHNHWATTCQNPTNQTCEQQYPTLIPSERVLSATCTFNCHGRTFANRSAWVDYAEYYLNDATGMSPTNPAIGDIIVFYSGTQTSHTVTIDGPWLGTNTMVKSKFGQCGEYRHALSKTIAVYKNNPYYVHRLFNTRVYSDPLSQAEAENTGNSIDHDKLAIENEEIYRTQTEPWIRRTTAMSSPLRTSFEKANSLPIKVGILINDIIDPRHFGVFLAYDKREYSPPEFIQGLEATEELASLSKMGFAQKTAILQKILSKIQSTPKLNDHQLAALVFAVEKISNEEDAAFVSKFVGFMKPVKNHTDGEYSAYYIDRLKKKFQIAN